MRDTYRNTARIVANRCKLGIQSPLIMTPEVPFSPLFTLDEFNQACKEYDREPALRMIETIPEELRQQYLAESLNSRLIAFAQGALQVLEDPQIQAMFGVGPEALSTWEETRYAMRNTPLIMSAIRASDRELSGAAFSVEENDTSINVFPFEKYLNVVLPDGTIREELYHLVTACQNIGHDNAYLPPFAPLLYIFHNTYNREVKKEVSRPYVEAQDQLLRNVVPKLYDGLVLYFSSIESMIRGENKIQTGSLSSLADIVAANLVVRAMQHRYNTIIYQGHPYAINPVTEGKAPRTLTIDTTGDDHRCTADYGLMFLTLYQLGKNSLNIFSDNNKASFHFQIKTGEVTVQGHPCSVIECVDNGTGIDISEVHRQSRIRFPDEPEFSTDWGWRNMTVGTLFDQVYRRRFSAAHGSGLGLAMVKDFVSRNDGVVWGTNTLSKGKEIGAKFLIILGTPDGSLKDNLPELYSDSVTPVELLASIDTQLLPPEETTAIAA